MKQAAVLVGVVTGAHGVQGEVKVKSFTTEARSIGAYGPLRTEDGRQYEVADMRAARADETRKVLVRGLLEPPSIRRFFYVSL